MRACIHTIWDSRNFAFEQSAYGKVKAENMHCSHTNMYSYTVTTLETT